MNVSTAIAEILKREGVDILFGYPRNAVLEAAALADIRTVIVRQCFSPKTFSEIGSSSAYAFASAA